MLYDNDIEKFGDINIVPKASEHLLVEEQRQMRAGELLERVDRSDTLKRLVGDKGLANLLREVVKITKMDATEIVPSEEDIERMEEQLLNAGAVPGVPGQPGMPGASAPGVGGGVVPGAAQTPAGDKMGVESGNVIQKKVT
jgi:hypothetical protein